MNEDEKDQSISNGIWLPGNAAGYSPIVILPKL